MIVIMSSYDDDDATKAPNLLLLTKDIALYFQQSHFSYKLQNAACFCLNGNENEYPIKDYSEVTG